MKYVLLLIAVLFLVGYSYAQRQIKKVELNNGSVKIECKTDSQGFTVQHFYAKSTDGKYTEIVRSFNPDYITHSAANSQMYNTTINPHRYQLSEILNSATVNRVNHSIELIGSKNGVQVKQTIRLQPNSNLVEIEVDVEFPESVNKLDFVLNTYELQLPHTPRFLHTPTMKFDNKESKQNRFIIDPSNQQIIGDRCFHSPAIIAQDENYFAALIPNLDKINQFKLISPDARRKNRIDTNIFCIPEVKDRYSMPTALDYSLNSGLSDKPIFSFGYMDAVISHHIRYNRPDSVDMTRTIDAKSLHYGFTLMLDAQNKINYQDVAQFIWEKYGSPQFARKAHLAMPFLAYEQLIDSVTFHPSTHPDIDQPLKDYVNNGSWLEWNENGVPMGGYRSAINWWNDKMHNSAFWNNARDASGFWYWGKQLNDARLLDRAHRIINWCLSAPQNKQGLFATLFNANTKTWALQFMDPMHGQCNFFKTESKSYDVATMSKTAAHLLQYYQECEKDNRILKYVQPYCDWLLTSIDARGSVPAFVGEDMTPTDLLRYTAHPAASMWLLAEMYNNTKEQKYLDGAQRISAYLEKEIIPEAKWVDFEQFYSCGSRPAEFDRDVAQNLIARGTLCLIWASEGYAALHRATHLDKVAKLGLACVDYLSFSQCSWNPHYIYTAYPFGGLTSDNSDTGNYLDARQAECVRPFAYWGKVLGRKDLLERSVAASKASMVLINHPRHKANEIYQYTNIYPFGLGPENIDHEAVPQSPMRTHPSWGEGSAVFTALTDVMKALGGAYINLDKNLSVGVDGIRIKSFRIERNTLKVELYSELFTLKIPWTKAYSFELHIDGLGKQALDLAVNGVNLGKITAVNTSMRLTISPDGKILKQL